MYRLVASICLLIPCAAACSSEDVNKRVPHATAPIHAGTSGVADGTINPKSQCQKTSGDPAGLFLANAKVTSDFPAVVRIGRRLGANDLSLCTGVFVSSTTLLTAAHCVDDTTNGGIMLVPGETFNGTLTNVTLASQAMAAGPTGSHVDFNDIPSLAMDVAAVSFDHEVSQAFITIATAAPAKGTRATLVGFGRTTLDDQPQDPNNDYRKRTGTNVVIDKLTGGTQIFTGGQTADESAAADGSAAFGEHGDSGGPLLVDGGVAGVLSSGGTGSRDGGPTFYFTTFTDLNTVVAQNFLSAAMAAGFKFEGMDRGTEPRGAETAGDSTLEKGGDAAVGDRSTAASIGDCAAVK